MRVLKYSGLFPYCKKYLDLNNCIRLYSSPSRENNLNNISIIIKDSLKKNIPEEERKIIYLLLDYYNINYLYQTFLIQLFDGWISTYLTTCINGDNISNLLKKTQNQTINEFTQSLKKRRISVHKIFPILSSLEKTQTSNVYQSCRLEETRFLYSLHESLIREINIH